MFVIHLHYTVPLEEIDNFRPAHLNWLQSYYNKGYFLASGRQNPPTGGVILAHGLSSETLERILLEDPFAEHGLATYHITEFTPNMTAPVLSFLTDEA